MFCVYVDGLLQRLASSKIGCNFGMIYVGVLAYADDIVLLAPTASAMRMLLSMCDDYANEYRIVFNAKKSKCMYCPPHKYRTLVQGQNPVFQIGGHCLEYVNEWPHLGHIV